MTAKQGVLQHRLDNSGGASLKWGQWVRYIWLVFVVLFGVSLRAPAKDVIHITNGEWPPYLSEDAPHHGFASHVVSEAFDAVGVRTEYGFFPWKRSYKYAKEGEDFEGGTWHGTVVWVYTEKRARDFLYSAPVVIDVEVLFYLKSNPLVWRTVEDLQGMRIGGTLHTVYPLFEEAEKKGILTLERGGNYDSLFKMLLFRRIDAVPQVKQVGRYFLKESLSPQERDRITFSPTVIQERKYHLILSKRVVENRRFLQLFNQGLRQIRESGLYDALYQNLDQGKYDRPAGN